MHHIDKSLYENSYNLKHLKPIFQYYQLNHNQLEHPNKFLLLQMVKQNSLILQYHLEDYQDYMLLYIFYLYFYIFQFFQKIYKYFN